MGGRCGAVAKLLCLVCARVVVRLDRCTYGGVQSEDPSARIACLRGPDRLFHPGAAMTTHAQTDVIKSTEIPATPGVWIALAVIGLWLGSLTVLLTIPVSQMPLWVVPVGTLWQTFLYTGLFITAHDAMHGAVHRRNRRVNDLFGWTAVILYALFDYRKMMSKHWEHHKHPGTQGDPDFHDGSRTGFFAWYVSFLRSYISIPQIIGMAVVFNILHHFAGVTVPNLLFFWAGPAILSTFQLFYFGTFLPHRDIEGGHDNPHHSTSNDYSPFWSFVSCYHFGYHLEHHEYPYVPWWLLPTVRAARKEV
ncbi:beta-carotene ketolase [bacterium]|nr:beta-carotene ketolase [bacterium]